MLTQIQLARMEKTLWKVALSYKKIIHKIY